VNAYGLVYQDKNDLNNATLFHQEALKLNEALNRKVGMAQNYANLGLICQTQGNNAEAIRYYQMSIALYKQLGDPFAQNIQILLNNPALDM